MSRISDAMLDTLLEEITDYNNVVLTEKQYDELSTICDEWEDKESIENEINRYLQKIGYKYNQSLYQWIPQFTITKENLLEYYFNTGADGDQVDYRTDLGKQVVESLFEKGEFYYTVQDVLNSCEQSTIPLRFLEEFPTDFHDEFYKDGKYELGDLVLSNYELNLID